MDPFTIPEDLSTSSSPLSSEWSHDAGSECTTPTFCRSVGSVYGGSPVSAGAAVVTTPTSDAAWGMSPSDITTTPIASRSPIRPISVRGMAISYESASPAADDDKSEDAWFVGEDVQVVADDKTEASPTDVLREEAFITTVEKPFEAVKYGASAAVVKKEASTTIEKQKASLVVQKQLTLTSLLDVDPFSLIEKSGLLFFTAGFMSAVAMSMVLMMKR
jgi:hypothetical protein